jgi:cardiolipin synthase (CMP-forming)
MREVLCPAWQEPRTRVKCGLSFVQESRRVNLPNLITICRIVLVPFVVWAITSDRVLLAFWLFIAAGISDAVDGFLAKWLRAESEFGAYLDPLADKALLMSIYVALSIVGLLPAWVVIGVVSRDIMILAAVVVAGVVGQPLIVRPLAISKLNTIVQILLAALVLGAHGLGFDPGYALPVLLYAVGALTGLSAAAYLVLWMRHMAA